MSLELRTCPIWAFSTGTWSFPISNISSIVTAVKNKTGLNVSKCSFSSLAYTSYGFAINFFGDNPPTTQKGFIMPAAVYIGGLNNSDSTMKITICSGSSGNTTSDVKAYTFDTGLSRSTSNPALRLNLGFIHHGNKTLITIVTDSMAASGYLTFAVIMDHARRRIIGLENLRTSTTVDNLATVLQSKAYDFDKVSGTSSSGTYDDTDPPTYTTSSFSVTPPNCSYNVVSLAPLVVPEESNIVEDCFIPVYLRDDTHAQQFDISNGEYTSNYVTSGASSAGTSQYVVRMDSTEIPPNNQT